MDTLLAAVQSGTNCSAACTAFIDSERTSGEAACALVACLLRPTGWHCGQVMGRMPRHTAAHASSRFLALAGLGINCLSDAVLKAFNETQPGMMGFSEDTVRQLV